MPHSTFAGAESVEQRLVFAAAAGDEGAIARLIDDHGRALLAFVYRRVGERLEDAEDITLDTFESASKLARTYDVRSSVFTWLCGIAKLRIIDFHRRATRDKRPPVENRDDLNEELVSGESWDEHIDRLEAERIVDEMLSGLSEDEREALLLRYVEQFSVREIATHMKRSEKGVEVLLTRAKSKPRSMIELWREGGAL